MKLVEVAATGDRLATLRTLRDTLAATIDGTDSARDIASLSKQMTDVLEQIEGIERGVETKGVSVVDVIIRNRAGSGKQGKQPGGKAKTGKPVARKPGAEGKGRAEGGGK